MKSKCPFCRELAPETGEEIDEQRMKRIKMNDPVALNQQGVQHYKKGGYSGAFEYWTKAAELGDADAHCKLSTLYFYGQGVEKDVGKKRYHTEEAAIGGHPIARYNLGISDLNNGNNIERGVKHCIIAARQGDDRSMKALLNAFKVGYVSKDDLAATLRAHQTAIDATKSPQRAAAGEFARRNNIK